MSFFVMIIENFNFHNTKNIAGDCTAFNILNYFQRKLVLVQWNGDVPHCRSIHTSPIATIFKPLLKDLTNWVLLRAQPISRSQRKRNEASLCSRKFIDAALSFLRIQLPVGHHFSKRLNWLSLFAAAIALIIHLEQNYAISPYKSPDW